jgi:hypothetical protein
MTTVSCNDNGFVQCTVPGQTEQGKKKRMSSAILTHKHTPYDIWTQSLEEGTGALFTCDSNNTLDCICVGKSLGWSFRTIGAHADEDDLGISEN